MPVVVRDPYQVLTQEEIYEHFFPELVIGEVTCSPFRDEHNPSFQLKYSANGKLYWTDYGYDYPRHDAAALIALTYDISIKEAFNLIKKEMINGGDIMLKRKKREPRSKPVKNRYQFFYKEFENYELSYWMKLGIRKPLLDFLNIKALRKIAKNGSVKVRSVRGNPAFLYLYKLHSTAFKLYRPFESNGFKFLGQDNGNLIEGWEQLPRNGEKLIINSSYKDTAVTWRVGIPSINPTSENSMKNLFISEKNLNLRFRNIYILFDNDRVGRESARKLQVKSDHKWTPIFMRKFKDPSDSVMNTGSYFDYLNILSINKVI